MSGPNGNPGTPGRRLPLALKLRLFVRSLSLQASWNHERMQNLGLLTTMLPWVRSRRTDLNHDRMFCRRYYEYFNTNPYLANFVIGGLVRLEDDRAAGLDVPVGMTAIFRDSLGRAFASLGDQLFWLGLRPALVMVICLLGLFNQIGLLIGVVGLFALVQLVLRWGSLEVGYRRGFDLVELLQHRSWHVAIAVTERAGMLLTGMTAGAYLALMTDVGAPIEHNLLWLGVGVGLGLPLALRRRFPGEVLVLVALALALVLAFAVFLTGS